jgi:general secretion pathway protein G
MQSRSPTRAARAAGFTLVEIMVVVVILGLLATLVVPNVVSSADEAKETHTATDVRTIAGAVRTYVVKHGRVPELAKLIEPDAKGRTLLESLPRDPWQGEYVLREGPVSGEFEVVSAGPDRTLGTADDISSRPPR